MKAIEKIICKQFLDDADKTHSCNEYKLLMQLLEQEPKEITLEDVKEYCEPRCLTIISNALLYELTHPKIKALEQEPRWIPVSERLPKAYEVVIASVDYGFVYPEARYSKEDGWQWAYEAGIGYWVELEEVKAWMPLPKPYKAESEE